MSLLKVAAELFISQLGSKGAGVNLNTVVNGLQTLLPTQGGDLDLGALIGKFTGQGGGGGGDLAALASSFLGSGAGKSIDIQQVLAALGKSKVDNFAGQVGVDTNTAASGLAGMLPQLLSQGKDSGLLGNLAGSAAKGVLGKLFK